MEKPWRRCLFYIGFFLFFVIASIAMKQAGILLKEWQNGAVFVTLMQILFGYALITSFYKKEHRKESL